MRKRRLFGLVLSVAAVMAVGLIAGVGELPAQSGKGKRASELATAFAQADGKAAAEAALQKCAELFVEAFHKGDAKALAAHWTPDGDYTDQTGKHMKGRDAIEKAFKDLFAENKGLKLRIDSDALRFITSDVAIEDGTTEVFSASEAPPSRARYTIVHVKNNGQWYLSSVRDAVFTPPSNQEHLSGLEWTVGDWAQEADKGEVERLSVTWAEGQNFIVANFSRTFQDVSLGSATQWIGWDPTAKRVRSWIFDAAGGFGEGSWSKNGKTWLNKTTTVLQDGKKASATYVITYVDADTIILQGKNRTLDGMAIPDTKEARLKRIK